MAERIVVVGADAAGMSAASQAKRLDSTLEILAFERGRFTSYSACGIPYWVAGDVDGPDGLVARTAEEHRANGIDLRMETEVVAIDVEARTVDVRPSSGGDVETHAYDQLVLATGASPVRPPIPGIDAEGIFGVQTLDDGAAVLAWLDDLGRTDRCRAVVVGAGYIGVEMAEALHRHGLTVTVVDKAAQPMATLDPDMGALVREAMDGMGITVVTDVSVDAFDAGDDGRVAAVVTSGGRFEADVVVLGLGVRPATDLAREAGLPLGRSGGIVTDHQMRVPGFDGVWAAGDCVEVRDRVSGEHVHIALGTHANKQGRVLGTNLGGGYDTFEGVVGTAISKVCDLEIARTGLKQTQAEAAGFDVVVTTTESTTRAGYFPGAEDITVKVIAERRSGRLLGVQIVGRDGSAKRIDTAAVALWNEMTVMQVVDLDLAYAPPFSPVWDPILIAARKSVDAVAADLAGLDRS
jgi:NADPH-dependent 2,4-dienoyl-CoA reductase/sulfur reductase-like enzyme